MSTGSNHRRYARTRMAAVAASAVATFSGMAAADTIFATEDPGGFFGYIGFDLYPQQSVAARFIPTAGYTLDRASIWFMSNDFDGTVPQAVTVTLRTDVNPGGEFDSVPSDVVLETWTRNISAVGWTPVLEDFDSTTHAVLQAGQKYWLVAESDVPALSNPIWVWAAFGNEFTATTDGPGTPWEGGFGAAVGLRVLGTPTQPPCRADFDHSGGLSVQDIFDFLAAYFGNDLAADMDNSGGLSVQDIFDFLALYFAGC